MKMVTAVFSAIVLGHCYSTSRDQDLDKSGHGCLLCLPEGQGHFPFAYTYSLGYQRRISGKGKEKKGHEF